MRAYMGHYFPIRKQIESLDLSPYYVHIVGICRFLSDESRMCGKYNWSAADTAGG